MSVYCVYDPFEGNDDNLEEELLKWSFMKFLVALLKTWKL